MSGAEKPGRHLDNLTLQVWIAVVERGGYWSVRDLHMGVFPTRLGKDLKDCLERLVENNMVRKRQPHGQHPGYGVTTLCKAPPGYEHFMTGAPK